MVAPIIGAALGGLQLIGGLFGQNRQARAQREQAKAQADSIKTQEHLTKLQVQQQTALSRSMTQLQEVSERGNRSLQLLQLDNEEISSRINQTQQRTQLDQKRFLDEQARTLASSNALINQTQELKQLEQVVQQGNQVNQELTQNADSLIAGEASRGQAGRTESDLTSLERMALGGGDNLQSILQLVTQGTDEAERQRLYEQGIALGLFDLDEIQSDTLDSGLDIAAELDTNTIDAARESTNTQSDRNLLALRGAQETEEARLNLATSSADVSSASQLRANSAQASGGAQGPGFLGVLSALGNTGLGFYDAIQTTRALRGPSVPANQTNGRWIVPSTSQGLVGGGTGLIPTTQPSPSIITPPPTKRLL